jgi:hypothetical protein
MINAQHHSLTVRRVVLLAVLLCAVCLIIGFYLQPPSTPSLKGIRSGKGAFPESSSSRDRNSANQVRESGSFTSSSSNSSSAKSNGMETLYQEAGQNLAALVLQKTPGRAKAVALWCPTANGEQELGFQLLSPNKTLETKTFSIRRSVLNRCTSDTIRVEALDHSGSGIVSRLLSKPPSNEGLPARALEVLVIP